MTAKADREAAAERRIATARRRDTLKLKGYSAAVASALAPIEDPETADLILRMAGRSGVKDGPLRGYYVKVVAAKVVAGYVNTGPSASMTEADARWVHDRATNDVRDGLA